ncbi:hypothetical protein AUTU_31150 [Aureibacter tunicatorum]|nr:hypothetical protein AUTU_31150 [Aureibacter tunicatorum]
MSPGCKLGLGWGNNPNKFKKGVVVEQFRQIKQLVDEFNEQERINNIANTLETSEPHY